MLSDVGTARVGSECYILISCLDLFAGRYVVFTAIIAREERVIVNALMPISGCIPMDHLRVAFLPDRGDI
jgi:hypothetical protein